MNMYYCEKHDTYDYCRARKKLEKFDWGALGFGLLCLAAIATLGYMFLHGVASQGQYVYNNEARIRAVCQPQAHVIRTDAQGYRGSGDILAVYCADGRWALLYEGYENEIHQPKIVKGH